MTVPCASHCEVSISGTTRDSGAYLFLGKSDRYYYRFYYSTITTWYSFLVLYLLLVSYLMLLRLVPITHVTKRAAAFVMTELPRHPFSSLAAL